MNTCSIDMIRDTVLDSLRLGCPDLPERSWAPLGTRIFDRLRQVGREAGFKVLDRHTTGEYLWDVAWTYEPRAEDAYWLELAAEIELTDVTTASVIDDLYKVLDAKARLKLFVACGTCAMVRALKEEIAWAMEHQRLALAEEKLCAVLVSYSASADL